MTGSVKKQRPGARHIKRVKSGCQTCNINLFDYFRVVCAQEFALFYESPDWKNLVLNAVFNEKFAYHAALAISAMTRAHYLGKEPSVDTLSPHEYANQQYSLAIQHLNARLESGWETAELAVFASVLFVNIEFLRATLVQTRRQNLINVHIQGGLAVLRQLQNSAAQPCLVGSWEVMGDALWQNQRQLEGLELMAKL
ncbi:hypothetical protein DM02DRAFT_728905 [Periconia macrospinosa]|uniref:Transcription factor domain-containing protein n=1 Tax=Periconia macrospinosa TaxID=97972 RepID=A0A2V1DR98_9PLEO|nr:hypothetical protein DM02DRAFT_728905 [Periconia macrospinosa]